MASYNHKHALVLALSRLAKLDALWMFYLKDKLDRFATCNPHRRVCAGYFDHNIDNEHALPLGRMLPRLVCQRLEDLIVRVEKERYT